MTELELRIITPGFGVIVWQPDPGLLLRHGDNLSDAVLPAAKVLQEVARTLAMRLAINEATMAYLLKVWDTIPGFGLDPDHARFLEALRMVVERHRKDTLERTLSAPLADQTFEMNPLGPDIPTTSDDETVMAPPRP